MTEQTVQFGKITVARSSGGGCFRYTDQKGIVRSIWHNDDLARLFEAALAGPAVTAAAETKHEEGSMEFPGVHYDIPLRTYSGS
jgi:hypothetical protein